MRKVLRIFVFYLISCLFAISLISATTTDIDVKTLPNHEVQVTVADGTINDFLVIKRFKQLSNEYGDVSFELVSDKPKINLYVYVKKDGETVIDETYLSYETGDQIDIELAPKWFELIETPSATPEENITFEELDNKTENKTEEAVKYEKGPNFIVLTGSAVKDFLTDKRTYYWGGAIILIIVLIFIGLKYKRELKKIGSDIKITKLSELQKTKEEKIENYKDTIKDAERKIKEAQKEIDSLRNRERIKSMERKIQEDQEELRKLRGRD